MSAIVKKLSVKTVCGDVKKIVIAGLGDKNNTEMENGKVFPIMTVLGSVKKVTEGEHDQYGTYYEFGGVFEAIAHCGANKGQSFRSNKCFLPDTASDLLVAEYNRVAEENDGEVSGIQIAFEIRGQIDDSLGQSYQFQVVPLMEAVEDDPLAMLKSQVKSAQKLEHKPAEKPAEKTEEKPAKKSFFK